MSNGDENGDGELVLSWRLSPRGRPIVEARRGGELLLSERVDLHDGAARERCARRLHAVTSIPPAEALRRLLGFADEASRAADAPVGNAATAFDEPVELDAARTCRAFLFYTTEASGVAVPVTVLREGKPAKSWRWLVQWRDGRREQRAVEASLSLPTGDRLWFYPELGEPPAMTPAGWSPESRRRWLDGERAPSAADVFAKVARLLGEYIDFPRHDARGALATLALWTMFTYTYTAWETSPYLILRGPAGSGKTRTLECLARLVFRPLNCASLTGPSLYRVLHSQGGTVMLDEAEALRNGARDPGTSELLACLLSGYRADGVAVRLEAFGDTFRPVAFSTYGPKAIAAIGATPEPLTTRALVLTMRRSPPGSPKPTKRLDEAAERWQAARDALHAWTISGGAVILDAATRAEPPAGLHARDAEKWCPLVALARLVEADGAEGLAKIVEDFALALAEATRDDAVPDHDELLLRLLAEARANLDAPQPRDLLERAREAEPAMFKSWTAKGVSNALRRYGLRTNVYSGRRVYGRVSLDDLRELETLYGLTLGLPEPADE